jgi:hypothetical protein
MNSPIWQRVEFVPLKNTGVPTELNMVTVCVSVFGPLQPAALAVITVVPVQEAT